MVRWLNARGDCPAFVRPVPHLPGPLEIILNLSLEPVRRTRKRALHNPPECPERLHWVEQIWVEPKCVDRIGKFVEAKDRGDRQQFAGLPPQLHRVVDLPAGRNDQAVLDGGVLHDVEKTMMDLIRSPMRKQAQHMLDVVERPDGAYRDHALVIVRRPPHAGPGIGNRPA
jgi:hypothetical protein